MNISLQFLNVKNLIFGRMVFFFVGYMYLWQRARHHYCELSLASFPAATWQPGYVCTVIQCIAVLVVTLQPV